MIEGIKAIQGVAKCVTFIAEEIERKCRLRTLSGSACSKHAVRAKCKVSTVKMGDASSQHCTCMG